MRSEPHRILLLNSLMVFPMLFLSLFTLSGEYHNALAHFAEFVQKLQEFGVRDAVSHDWLVVLHVTKDGRLVTLRAGKPHDEGRAHPRLT